MRPNRVIAVLGTHTEVGKTWVSRRLLLGWKAKGFRASARKPVQSFDDGSGPTDADILASATSEDPRAVCPTTRWYPRAMAPPMAADVLNRPPIALKDLIRELAWPSDVDFGLVETVGGTLSPLSHDGSSLDLVRALHPDRVVLVADAGLGTINSIRLAMEVLANVKPQVLLNRYDASVELHQLNASWLQNQDGIGVAIDVETVMNWAINDGSAEG